MFVDKVTVNSPRKGGGGRDNIRTTILQDPGDNWSVFL